MNTNYKGPAVIIDAKTPIGDILFEGNVFTIPGNIQYFQDPFWYQGIPEGFLRLPIFDIDNKFVQQKVYQEAKILVNHYENKLKHTK